MSRHARTFARSDTTYDQLALRGATDSVDDRRTPAYIFEPLDAEFGFTLDVAATADNTLCPRYFTPEQDGLVEPWAGERVWCNPPFSTLAPWVRKAWLDHPATDVIVMLLPANRTDQRWWADMVEPFRDRGAALRTRFIRGRVDFEHPDGRTSSGGPTAGCVLLIWQAYPPAPPES